MKDYMNCEIGSAEEVLKYEEPIDVSKLTLLQRFDAMADDFETFLRYKNRAQRVVEGICTPPLETMHEYVVSLLLGELGWKEAKKKYIAEWEQKQFGVCPKPDYESLFGLLFKG